MSVRKLTNLCFGAIFFSISASIALSVTTGSNSAAALSALSLLMLAFCLRLISTRIFAPLKKIETAIADISRGDCKRGVSMGDLPEGEFSNIALGLGSLSSAINEFSTHHLDLLKNIPDAVIELDNEGKVLYMNEAAAALTGYEEDETAGMHYLEFMPEDEKEKASETFCRILKGQSVRNFELKLIRKDGRINYSEFNAVPVYKAGEITGCCCVGRDTDERRKIMDEVKKARKTAEENSKKLEKTVSDLEEFALLAVRRELKMQEIRERLVELKNRNAAKAN